MLVTVWNARYLSVRPLQLHPAIEAQPPAAGGGNSSQQYLLLQRVTGNRFGAFCSQSLEAAAWWRQQEGIESLQLLLLSHTRHRPSDSAVCFVLWLLLLPAACHQVVKNKIRGVNMKGFGYGGEDAYFYASAQ